MQEMSNRNKLFVYFPDIKCKELKDNDLMRISYTNRRNIGSKATFHCLAPGKRSGEPFAVCLENGTWSNPTPVCRSEFSLSVLDIVDKN